MALRTDKLYLIRTTVRIRVKSVAAIIGKDPLEAINKYLERIGFNDPYAYFCHHLMTNGIVVESRSIFPGECFNVVGTKTINDDFIRISSQPVLSGDDIFALSALGGINEPSFIRPTAKEVRNCCAGFSKIPMYELKKFCI